MQQLFIHTYTRIEMCASTFLACLLSFFFSSTKIKKKTTVCISLSYVFVLLHFLLLQLAVAPNFSAFFPTFQHFVYTLTPLWRLLVVKIYEGVHWAERRAAAVDGGLLQKKKSLQIQKKEPQLSVVCFACDCLYALPRLI